MKPSGLYALIVVIILHSSCTQQQVQPEPAKTNTAVEEKKPEPGKRPQKKETPVKKQEPYHGKILQYSLNIVKYFDPKQCNSTVQQIMLNAQDASLLYDTVGLSNEFVNQFLYLNPEFAWREVDPLPTTRNGEKFTPPSPTLLQILENRRQESGRKTIEEDIIMLDGKFFPVVYPDCRRPGLSARLCWSFSSQD